VCHKKRKKTKNFFFSLSKMKTFGFSFFILYALGITEATRLLRGMIAAMAISDQREHNAHLPDIPILPPTYDTHKFNPPPLENNEVHVEPSSDNNYHIITAIGND
jgi:hypothetical protein